MSVMPRICKHTRERKYDVVNMFYDCVYAHDNVAENPYALPESWTGHMCEPGQLPQFMHEVATWRSDVLALKTY